MKVADLVIEAIKPMFDLEKEIKLVDVEYKKLQDGMHLIIYIDKTNGIMIEDCEYISKKVDEILDELNPTADVSYRLDVSSYGLDKPLKHDWQLKKYLNKLVDVKLYKKVDSKKEFVATLISFTDTEYVFSLNDSNIKFDKSAVAFITPHIEF